MTERVLVYTYLSLDPIFLDIFDFIFLADEREFTWKDDLQIFLGLGLIAWGVLGIASLMFEKFEAEQEEKRLKEEEEEAAKHRAELEELRKFLEESVPYEDHN